MNKDKINREINKSREAFIRYFNAEGSYLSKSPEVIDLMLTNNVMGLVYYVSSRKATIKANYGKVLFELWLMCITYNNGFIDHCPKRDAPILEIAEQGMGDQTLINEALSFMNGVPNSYSSSFVDAESFLGQVLAIEIVSEESCRVHKRIKSLNHRAWQDEVQTDYRTSRQGCPYS